MKPNLLNYISNMLLNSNYGCHCGFHNYEPTYTKENNRYHIMSTCKICHQFSIISFSDKTIEKMQNLLDKLDATSAPQKHQNSFSNIMLQNK